MRQFGKFRARLNLKSVSWHWSCCLGFVSYVAATPDAYDGQIVGNGQSVGTAIATFDAQGNYGNLPTGNHAAIVVADTAAGLEVRDQWSGQPVHKRTIRFQNGAGSPSDDGDAFSVIE